MAGIKIMKYLTEHYAKAKREGREARKLPYLEAHDAGIRGGTVTTEVTIDPDYEVAITLKGDDLLRVVNALVTAHSMISPEIYGLDRTEVIRRVRERNNIERLLERLGTDDEAAFYLNV